MVSRYILLLFSFLALQASAKQAFNEEEDEAYGFNVPGSILMYGSNFWMVIL